MDLFVCFFESKKDGEIKYSVRLLVKRNPKGEESSTQKKYQSKTDKQKTTRQVIFYPYTGGLNVLFVQKKENKNLPCSLFI